MNTLMIREFGDFRIPDSNCFDRQKQILQTASAAGLAGGKPQASAFTRI